MGKTYTMQYVRMPPLLLWHDDNFIKLFKGILHSLHCIFLYRYSPSFNPFHDTCISWSSNKFSVQIFRCVTLQPKEISRQRMKFCTDNCCSYCSPLVRGQDLFNTTVCRSVFCGWVLNKDVPVCVHLKSRIGVSKDWWWVTVWGGRSRCGVYLGMTSMSGG